MPKIPKIINGVTVQLAASVNLDVDQRVIDALLHCISPNVAPPHQLQKIYISSAADSHVFPSRHAQRKAVDISRLNGTKIAVGYPANPLVKAVVDAIQQKFETYVERRENYGPSMKKRLGIDYQVPGHQDHVHLSVN